MRRYTVIFVDHEALILRHLQKHGDLPRKFAAPIVMPGIAVEEGTYQRIDVEEQLAYKIAGEALAGQSVRYTFQQDRGDFVMRVIDAFRREAGEYEYLKNYIDETGYQCAQGFAYTVDGRRYALTYYADDRNCGVSVGRFIPALHG